ncbi:MAG: type II toxin-antitoxin system RelE/ParE family toxin [Elusimicrobia bacterium]|nr:type II toxin-antitoxin system RelE/ParE family toxin [Elusimicrobiota bacterium]
MARYAILLRPSAVKDFDRLRKYDAAAIADGMERFLGDRPARESGSRIKRLRGISSPDFRLRLGEHRVFYNLNDEERRVDVLRILHKDETAEYYEEVKP